MIDFFWDEPREWNGDMLGYVVNCTLDDIVVAGGNISARHSRSFTFTVKSGRVRCIIAARNEQSLVGAFSDPISIDSSGEPGFLLNYLWQSTSNFTEFRPLVRLFAVDSTSQIQAITNWSSVVVPDVPSSSRARRQVSPAVSFRVPLVLMLIHQFSCDMRLWLSLTDVCTPFVRSPTCRSRSSSNWTSTMSAVCFTR